MQYEYKVKIEAETKQQAEEALKAMLDIKKSVSHNDLVFFAQKIKSNPGLVQTAKKFL